MLSTYGNISGTFLDIYIGYTASQVGDVIKTNENRNKFDNYIC